MQAGAVAKRDCGVAGRDNRAQTHIGSESKEKGDCQAKRLEANFDSETSLSHSRAVSPRNDCAKGEPDRHRRRRMRWCACGAARRS
eukprot:3050689-Pleurochrysis_carterae.AAC.1